MSKTTVKAASNGQAQKPTATKTATTKPTAKAQTAAAPKPAEPTPTAQPAKEVATLVRDRLQKRSKLLSLYQDVDDLHDTLSAFNGIQNYSDIRISVFCGTERKFSTSRTDTVEAGLKAVEQSIREKLEQAQKDLAAFEF